MSAKDLKGFLLDFLNVDEIGADDDLFTNGLDSLSLFELILFIEEKFEIDIKPEEVKPGNFTTMGKILELVERKKSESVAQ